MPLNLLVQAYQRLKDVGEQHSSAPPRRPITAQTAARAARAPHARRLGAIDNGAEALRCARGGWEGRGQRPLLHDGVGLVGATSRRGRRGNRWRAGRARCEYVRLRSKAPLKRPACSSADPHRLLHLRLLSLSDEADELDQCLRCAYAIPRFWIQAHFAGLALMYRSTLRGQGEVSDSVRAPSPRHVLIDSLDGEIDIEAFEGNAAFGRDIRQPVVAASVGLSPRLVLGHE